MADEAPRYSVKSDRVYADRPTGVAYDHDNDPAAQVTQDLAAFNGHRYREIDRWGRVTCDACKRSVKASRALIPAEPCHYAEETLWHEQNMARMMVNLADSLNEDGLNYVLMPEDPEHPGRTTLMAAPELAQED